MSDKKKIDWTEILHAAITVPGSMGSTYNRFYRYSFLNQVLLWSQGANEPCASYNAWKDMGRQVRKGTHGYLINRPVTRKRRHAAEDDENATYTAFVLTGGAHPYSHTDGDEPLPPYDPPSWSLEKAKAELGVTQVAFEHTDGNAQGYSYGHHYALNPMAAYPLKTTLHELAHIVLGHTTETSPDREYHQGLREFQAEASAHLLMRELEAEDQFDPAESRAYIQNWLSDSTNVPDKAISGVFKAVETILKAGR